MSRSAGVLCVSRRGRLLLCLRSDSRVWATPGGHVEPGETPAEAAVRELVEETRFAGTLEGFREVTCSARFCLFSAVTREFAPVLDHEHADYKWAPVRELPTPLHPGLAWLRNAQNFLG